MSGDYIDSARSLYKSPCDCGSHLVVLMPEGNQFSILCRNCSLTGPLENTPANAARSWNAQRLDAMKSQA